MERFNQVNFNLDSRPWHFVVWNPINKKMMMSSDTVTQLLLIYLYDREILEAKELQKLKQDYASKISYESEDIDGVLDEIE